MDREEACPAEIQVPARDVYRRLGEEVSQSVVVGGMVWPHWLAVYNAEFMIYMELVSRDIFTLFNNIDHTIFFVFGYVFHFLLLTF